MKVFRRANAAKGGRMRSVGMEPTIVCRVCVSDLPSKPVLAVRTKMGAVVTRMGTAVEAIVRGDGLEEPANVVLRRKCGNRVMPPGMTACA
jgi:hypothetical protein